MGTTTALCAFSKCAQHCARHLWRLLQCTSMKFALLCTVTVYLCEVHNLQSSEMCRCAAQFAFSCAMCNAVKCAGVQTVCSTICMNKTGLLPWAPPSQASPHPAHWPDWHQHCNCSHRAWVTRLTFAYWLRNFSNLRHATVDLFCLFGWLWGVWCVCVWGGGTIWIVAKLRDARVSDGVERGWVRCATCPPS